MWAVVSWHLEGEVTGRAGIIQEHAAEEERRNKGRNSGNTNYVEQYITSTKSVDE